MITSKRIHEILLDCLLVPEELEGDKPKKEVKCVEARGCKLTADLVKSRLESYREEIVGFLRELPETFAVGTGGGWSFLNLCVDKDGRQWGEHQDCDELLVLGLALGLITIPLSRDLWAALPGGVPYVTFRI